MQDTSQSVEYVSLLVYEGSRHIDSSVYPPDGEDTADLGDSIGSEDEADYLSKARVVISTTAFTLTSSKYALDDEGITTLSTAFSSN